MYNLVKGTVKVKIQIEKMEIWIFSVTQRPFQMETKWEYMAFISSHHYLRMVKSNKAANAKE
jgi:hypothetical protein